MAKKKTETVVEKTTKANEPKGDVTKVKEKMKMKPIVEEQTVTKVDLNKPPTPKDNEEIKEDTVDDGRVVELVKDADTSEKQEEVQSETETQETSTLEEITEEEVQEEVEELTEQVEEAVAEAEATGKPVPENIQKLMEFMEDTGGDLNDYVRLNQDYSNVGEEDLLYEYYKQTKPHLNNEEINFLMEDQFSYDEEIEEERDIKRKKLALKEQVAQARQHLDGAKSKYYEDIKAGSKLTSEQQKAIDFFNTYNEKLEKTQKATKANSDLFSRETEKVFNDKFKGFEYNVGEKKYRFNVNNADEVKNNQSDLNNFTKKFLDKNMGLKDAKGYHKSLYTAMNADIVAQHFYEQGKADAIKESIAKSKNINMNPRQGHEDIGSGGFKARVIGDNSPDFKFKIKNNKFKQ